VKFNLGARFARVKAANAPTAILRSSESAAKKPTVKNRYPLGFSNVDISVVDHLASDWPKILRSSERRSKKKLDTR
jgi:hypothetical protein